MLCSVMFHVITRKLLNPCSDNEANTWHLVTRYRPQPWTATNATLLSVPRRTETNLGIKANSFHVHWWMARDCTPGVSNVEHVEIISQWPVPCHVGIVKQISFTEPLLWLNVPHVGNGRTCRLPWTANSHHFYGELKMPRFHIPVTWKVYCSG